MQQLADIAHFDANRKTVCVQGLGFVGSAMALAVAAANADDGKPLYNVIGIDIANEAGRAKAEALNSGVFPFENSDENLNAALTRVHDQGNFCLLYTSAPLVVRNKDSVRPYQHVLEPLFAYLLIVARQSDQPQLAGYYNVGPDEDDCITTGELIELFAKYWGEEFDWEAKSDPNAPHEAGYLGLNSSKIKKAIGWEPRWNIDETVAKTVEWYKGHSEHQDIVGIIDKQITEYMEV